MKCKFVSLVLVIVFVLTSTLAGCQKSEPKVKGTQIDSSNTETDSNDSTKSADELEPVVLKWYIAGSEQPGLSEVVDEFNKRIKEKINATVDITLTDWGSYQQKMQLMIASGEEFDLCFTSYWLNNYLQNVGKNAFIPIDDLLKEYSPNAYKQIPEKIWDTVRVKGKIYGFINYQIACHQPVIFINKKYAEKYNFDASTVKTIADIEPFLQEIAKNEPDKLPINLNSGNSSLDTLFYDSEIKIEELTGRRIPGAIKIDDSTATAVNQFKLDEYYNIFKLAKKWHDMDFWRKDLATVTDTSAERKAGKFVIETGGTYKPGVEGDLAAQIAGSKPSDWITVTFGEPYLGSNQGAGTMHAISKTSKNPERAMMLLELINTDKELYNLLCYGIEGKHYKKIDENHVEPVENSTYNPNIDWEFGYQFNAYYKKGVKEGTWEETIELNEAAKPSPVLGFSFDSEPVKSEIAKCQAIVDEYVPLLATGSVELDKYYNEFIEKLEKAGSEIIVAELQKQIDEWKKTK